MTNDANEWVMNNSLPIPIADSRIVINKNKIYLLGGYNCGALSDVYIAHIKDDGTLGEWMTSGPLPIEFGTGQAVIINNNIYLLGGYNDSDGSLSNVYIGHINDNGIPEGWTTGLSLPVPVGFSQVIAIGNRIYLLGGYNDTDGYLSNVYTTSIKNNGTLEEWTTGPSLPIEISDSQVTVIKDRIYLLGGRNSSALSNVYMTFIYDDGTIDEWIAIDPLPKPISGAQAAVIGNKVYLLGGYNESDGYLSDVYIATINDNGTLGSWTTGSSLPKTIAASQVAVIKNKIYLLGGYNSEDGYLSTVYTTSIKND